jgi:hypothetical protein
MTEDGSRHTVFNPPTPKASAWQALTCLAVAKAKEERPTSLRAGGQRPMKDGEVGAWQARD